MSEQTHVFTCPDCGGHYWGTGTINNTNIGHCHDQYGVKCKFTWDRNKDDKKYISEDSGQFWIKERTYTQAELIEAVRFALYMRGLSLVQHINSLDICSEAELKKNRMLFDAMSEDHYLKSATRILKAGGFIDARD